MSAHPGAKRLNTVKFAVAAVAATYCAYYATHTQEWHFLDGVDLFIHEGGHIVFMPLGEFMHVLGGSLMQCLMPALFVIHFFRKGDFYSAALCGFWVGINLVNVSVYAGDAVAMDLPLLGGDDVIHDWNWLLTDTNTLRYTAQISGAIYGAGILAFVLATFSSIMFSRETTKAEKTAVAMDPLDPAWPRDEKFEAGLRLPGKYVIWAILGVAGVVTLVRHGSDLLPGNSASAKSLWPNNYAQAMAQAKTGHKPVLLSFTGSDWCPACQQLDEDILNTKTFKAYAEQNLVFVEVDIPKHTSQPAALRKQNSELQRKFEVQAFPTVIILSSKGNELDELVGCPPGGPAEYIQQIEAILKKYPQG